jgi:hypothetical protein
MWVHPVTYDVVAAFVAGFDTACEGGVLVGFKEWLVPRVGSGRNLGWERLVLDVAFPNAISARDALAGEAANRHAIDTLFDLIEQFDKARSEFEGLNEIFVAYDEWVRADDALGDLQDEVTRALADGALAGDKRLYPMISQALCELMSGELDDEQKAALEDARKFWAGEGADATRLEWVERLWRREFGRAGLAPTKVESVNRLVLGTLHTNCELTADAAGSLIEEAERAGLSAPQIAGAFAKSLPSVCADRARNPQR